MPPNAGQGRPKGALNKTTSILKDAILMAAEQRGSDGLGKDGLAGYCQFLADKQPRAFAQLLGKVLPMQVALTTFGKSAHEYSDAELAAIIASEQERREEEEEEDGRRGQV
jgi:hypothetical protein